MATTHSTVRVIQGDTWKIHGTMLDAKGSVLDISGAIIEWKLYNSSNTVSLVKTSANSEIQIVDGANGKCDIIVSSDVSKNIPVGEYSDRLRVTLAGTVSTMWRGQIEVEYSPF